MTLWLSFALMTAAVIVGVLWPLRRARKEHGAGSDVAVYRDQLAEIKRDRLSGWIGEAEAKAAQVEVSRRLLAAADAADAQSQDKPAPDSLRRRRAVALTTLVALPLGTFALYLLVGSPNLPAQPLSARLNTPLEGRSIPALVAKVEDHLAQHPEDGRGWQVLAPIYLRMGRFDDAVKAWRNTLRLLGESADGEADLGEALVGAANGVVTAEAAGAFEHALALDNHNVKARFFTGLSAEQDGKRDQAAAIWRDLLQNAPTGAPWIALVRQSLAQIDPNAVPNTPSVAADNTSVGPTADQVAAAADMSPEDRAQMVRTMVERLAQRLTKDGTDVENWLRLIRAYAVLGERDKALGAAARAREALAGADDKVRRIDELLKGLGLEG
ncbi:MAG TPA: c-type cytochrome biogenesis protein CcmI [Xanthobacteraceae bacterium]|nr:c-type cytochrome biogenesis protein CcmI [Xanthobacteraceae bacterium]